MTAWLANSAVNTADAAGDVFLVEGVVGSNFADTLIGDSAGNVLQGLDGDDRLDGQDGNDLLLGGNGDDIRITTIAGSRIDVAADTNGDGRTGRLEASWVDGYGVKTVERKEFGVGVSLLQQPVAKIILDTAHRPPRAKIATFKSRNRGSGLRDVKLAA